MTKGSTGRGWMIARSPMVNADGRSYYLFDGIVGNIPRDRLAILSKNGPEATQFRSFFMTGRTIAIGDIHGCARALERVLDALDLQADDHLITLGDVVDRGPDVRSVVDLLLLAATKCRLSPILGNHEEMMLQALGGHVDPEFWLVHGGAATLASYGFSGRLDVVPRAHLEFLASGLNFVATPTHFFVHANYLPEAPLEEQPGEVLRWTTLDERLPPRHVSGKVAVVGHTAEESGEILSLPHLKCIDTYCYGGKWLTALDVGSGQLWQADQQGRLRCN